MEELYLEEYLRITKGYTAPPYPYLSPEDQGASIKKCSILETTNIGYTNETKDSAP